MVSSSLVNSSRNDRTSTLTHADHEIRHTQYCPWPDQMHFHGNPRFSSLSSVERRSVHRDWIPPCRSRSVPLPAPDRSPPGLPRRMPPPTIPPQDFRIEPEMFHCTRTIGVHRDQGHAPLFHDAVVCRQFGDRGGFTDAAGTDEQGVFCSPVVLKRGRPWSLDPSNTVRSNWSDGRR